MSPEQAKPDEFVSAIAPSRVFQRSYGRSDNFTPGGNRLRVALLTGGRDKPYALGLASALSARGLALDFIGSDEVDSPELHSNPQVNYLNLRNQHVDASRVDKVRRVLAYYFRLARYAATAEPKLLHILWNNKFECFDRTFLMLYYKLFGKKIVFTAHNVNAGIRDTNDSLLNRVSLWIQYRLSDHVLVHTQRMKTELVAGFGIPEGRVTVIPFGINNTVPKTTLTPVEAKCQLGVGVDNKTLLFFGNIAPYKGLEYLIAAFVRLVQKDPSYRLIIAGRPKGPTGYWSYVREAGGHRNARERIIEKIEYIPDAQTELYFKAADVLILPYTHVFQSGVLFLGYSFGLPAIATDAGSLKESVIEQKTGFVCRAQDSVDLEKTILRYFESDLFRNLESRRVEIKQHANERYSWDEVATITTAVYTDLLACDCRNLHAF